MSLHVLYQKPSQRKLYPVQCITATLQSPMHHMHGYERKIKDAHWCRKCTSHVQIFSAFLQEVEQTFHYGRSFSRPMELEGELWTCELLCRTRALGPLPHSVPTIYGILPFLHFLSLYKKFSFIISYFLLITYSQSYVRVGLIYAHFCFSQ